MSAPSKTKRKHVMKLFGSTIETSLTFQHPFRQVVTQSLHSHAVCLLSNNLNSCLSPACSLGGLR